MEYRRLGRTGLDVSVLGFGTWQLGGVRWHAPTEEDSVELLRTALAVGINLFDVSPAYGAYVDSQGVTRCRSLDLLGRAFEDRRERVTFCLKLGQLDERTHFTSLHPRDLVSQLRKSLELLHSSYADLCLIHAPTIAEIRSGKSLSFLHTVKSLGLVRAIGYSVENEPVHFKAALSQEIDVVMCQLNILDPQCAELGSWAVRAGIGVIASSPFKRGYLTGLYGSISDLPDDDDYWTWNKTRCPAKVADLLERTRALVKRSGSPESLRSEALRFCAGLDGIASVVVGHRRRAEIEENTRHLAAGA